MRRADVRSATPGEWHPVTGAFAFTVFWSVSPPVPAHPEETPRDRPPHRARPRPPHPAPDATPDLSSRDPDWWRQAVVYQIYPRSFADADGDGLGDLRGITRRLTHLSALGVDALWLSPFYPSELADGGYDVADPRDVDPRLGTLDDFDALVREAHRLGLKVIVDIVPNHTSHQHVWFQEALRAGPGSPARDRYVFRDGRGESGELPPTDWQSVFGGSAWQRVPDGQWYLHLFAAEQPDLNWDHPDVREDFRTTLRFWSDRGVDGFRVDVAHALTKDLEEPLRDLGDHAGRRRGGPRRLRARHASVLRPRRGARDLPRLAEDLRHVHPAAYGRGGGVGARRAARPVRPPGRAGPGLQLRVPRGRVGRGRAPPGHHRLAGDRAGGRRLGDLGAVQPRRGAARLPADAAARHGHQRLAAVRRQRPAVDAEAGLRRARAATLLMLALPGSAYVYQGEELGLPEVADLPAEVLQDPIWEQTGRVRKGRDGCRVPLPWTTTGPSYGFGANGAWLPQPPSFAAYAVEAQDGVEGSTLELYRTACGCAASCSTARR